MRILQVEDDPAISAVVQDMLRADGHVCNSTVSGENAVVLSTSDDYDVILLNVALPDINGTDVVRLIRESGVETPVVMVTGPADRDASSDELPFGVADRLVKPFNKSELIERLQAAARANGGGALSTDEEIGADEPEAAPPAPNRRIDRRHASLKSAKIAYKSGIDCIVLNLSSGGAALQMPAEDTTCPSKFTMRLKSGAVYRCETCWREGDRLGVKFISAKQSRPVPAAKST